jgi:hypothetical protein
VTTAPVERAPHTIAEGDGYIANLLRGFALQLELHPDAAADIEAERDAIRSALDADPERRADVDALVEQGRRENLSRYSITRRQHAHRT